MTTVPDQTVHDADIADHLSDTNRVSVGRPILIMLDGRDANKRHRIDKAELTLGRDQQSDVVLADNKCSRHHAKLHYSNFDKTCDTPQIEIEDLKSTNGVFVNGVKIERHKLNDRDKILLGSSLIGFFLRDESELEADQRLLFLASNDALTGLKNRGAFNMEVQREFERGRRYTRNVSLVLFDIDHFKRFNDTYGHQMGDFVLQELGRLVQSKIRGNDIAARYGGEEFAIILPETGIDGALIQAERLRASIANHAFSRDGTSFNITVSLGIAAIEPAIVSTDDFIRWADRALYRSKAEGRNRVSFARENKIYDAAVTV
jgi:diguanylate cyclase (GGDEF)-like protein